MLDLKKLFLDIKNNNLRQTNLSHDGTCVWLIKYVCNMWRLKKYEKNDILNFQSQLPNSAKRRILPYLP